MAQWGPARRLRPRRGSAACSFVPFIHDELCYSLPPAPHTINTLLATRPIHPLSSSA